MTKQRERFIPGRDERLRPPKLPLADLAAADEKLMNLYRIYGRQEPGPLDDPVKQTRRGRT